ncbi:MAG: VWA domain-containing protein [Deltaproteobacteria bacterium]|nr:VWA domain-containing protein [Deltaproteobacteria bacterium]
MQRKLASKLWILFCLALLAGLAGLYYYFIWYLGRRTITTHVAGYSITFEDLRMLGVILVVPVLWMVQAISLTDLSRFQQVLSIGLRSLLVVVLALAMSRPIQKKKHQKVCSVFLLDVSASVSDRQLAEAKRIIKKAAAHKGTNLIRVIAFAGRPKQIDPNHLDDLKRFKGPDGERTNLRAALQLAYALYPADTIKRMLILSDGLQTTGNALAEAYRASDAGIKIHHWSFEAPAYDEVLVEDVKLPDKVEIGKKFNVTVEVYSNHPTKAKFLLKHGTSPDDMYWNELQSVQTVDLKPGRNIVKFPTIIHEAGLVAYVVEMRLPGAAKDHDTVAENNHGAAIMTIKDKPRVLVVDGGRRGHLDKFLYALRQEDYRVELRGRHGFPTSPWGLKKFHCVIQSDVSVSAMGLSQMRAIDRYVHQFGGCYIMAGGENSFGSGGFQATRIERILPVRMDTERQRRTPYVALVLAIDRSGSMSSGRKIELAKDAAKASAEVLSGNDLMGVVAFDSQAHPVVPLQRAANRLRILTAISSIVASGGTRIYPALRTAYEWLVPARAKVKHVILMTDGLSPLDGTYSLLEDMRQHHITVSTVGVGSDVDRNLLSELAKRGGGRFYFTNDPNNIPKIFVKETREVARPSIQEGAYVAQTVKSADYLRGTGITQVRYFRGYNPTKAKPGAELVLVLNPSGDPLLAKWHWGLGQTVAFTSDIKGGWTADWMEQSFGGFRKFWSQLLRSVMRSHSFQQFPMTIQVRNSRVHLSVDAVDRNDKYLDDLSCKLDVYDWERPGAKRRVALSQTAAGRYEASFTMPRYGAYVIQGRCRRPYKTSNGKIHYQTVAETFGSVTLSYPREYLDMQPAHRVCIKTPKVCHGLLLLDRLSAITAGQGLDPEYRLRHPNAKRLPLLKALFDPEGRFVETTVALWPYFLLALLLLLLFDVLLRRVRIFGYRRMRAA